MSISGNDIFGKNGNLSRNNLKKAKKKKNLAKLLKSELPILVEYYFTTFNKKDERRKFEEPLLKLVGSEAYFIEPIRKLLKKAKKDKELELPIGLATMLMDNLDEIRRMYRAQINKMGGNGNLTEDAKNRIETIKELSNLLIEHTTDIVDVLNKKRIKKLTKLGMSEEYAKILARTWVPAKCLSSHNIRRYVYRTNLALYDIQRIGVKQDNLGDEENRFKNDVGLNLSDPDVIKDIYELMFKGIERKTYINMLVGIMLERKGERYTSFTKQELVCFNAIKKLILDVLEGNEFINISKEKMSKKEAKKELKLSKKELKHFMQLYSEERAKDQDRKRDSARRVSFSNLDKEDYPNIVKAFKKCNKAQFDDMFEPVEPRENNENQNKNNQNQSNSKNDKDKKNRK